MLTLQQVLEKHPSKRMLINAVINHISITNVADVINLGANAGFSGFIYFHDTGRFYRKHRKQINAMVFEIADQNNCDPVNMLFYTPVFEKCTEDQRNTGIGSCLLMPKMPDEIFTEIEHAFTLFALENVCKLFFLE